MLKSQEESYLMLMQQESGYETNIIHGRIGFHVTNRVVEGGCHVFDARVMISELAEQGSSDYSK